MADDWIKFRKKLWRDGRVVTLSRKCRAARATVIGGLVALWSLADDFADAQGVLQGYTALDLDAEIGIENFCACLPPDWYTEVEGLPQLPRYHEHNGTTAKARALNSRRQNLSRSARDKSATRGEEIRRDKKRKGKTPLPPCVFRLPSIEEVAAYCRERANAVEPAAFVDFYASKGWKVGNQPMKDWQAAVRTWERNSRKTANSTGLPFSEEECREEK